MKGGRLTIAGLLGLIALVAIAAAAVRSASTLWAQAVFTLALTALIFATLAASVGRRDRSFAVGFAVVGWSYFVLSLGPWFEQNVAPWLLSTRIADEVYARFLQEEKNSHMQEMLAGSDLYPWSTDAINWMDNSRYSHYRRIVQSLAAIGHGLVGGVAALWLARKPRTDPAKGSP